jgi:hypothetical protein
MIKDRLVTKTFQKKKFYEEVSVYSVKKERNPLSVVNRNSTLKERMKEISLVFFLNPNTTRFSR